MRRARWVHARERQLERHPKPRADLHHIFLVQLRERRGDFDRRGQPERERRVQRREELRRGVGKRIPGQRGHDDARDVAACGVDGGLRQQRDVAAVQVDILVGRVVGGRRPGERPVRLRVHVAHAEFEAREGLQRVWRAGEWRAAEQLADDALFTFFPREPSGDINWMDNIRPGFLRRRARRCPGRPTT